MSGLARALAWGALAGCLGAGCGPSAKLLAADETLMATMAAVDESDQVVRAAESDAPGPAVEGARAAWERASSRLEEAQSIVRTWRDTGHGELAWVTLSPCLAASLVGLRMTLEAAALPIPEDLPQAEAMAADPAGDECASEPRPEIVEAETEREETSESGDDAASESPPPSGDADTETETETSVGLTPAQ